VHVVFKQLLRHFSQHADPVVHLMLRPILIAVETGSDLDGVYLNEAFVGATEVKPVVEL
jgi:hypothetical protein